MKRVQHTQNFSDTKKIERLISNTKSKEKGKKTEQILIMGIVLFCLSMLYFVFITTSSGNISSSGSRPHNLPYQPSSKEESSKNKVVKNGKTVSER